MAITFVNPYNFIPLANDKNKKRESIVSREELFSGKIKYTIKTVTPLFIPNTSNDRYFDIRADHETDDEYHKSYDFFSYTDLSKHSASEGIEYTPVIPGSEMRGAVRSLYETFTDSCFSAMDSDAILSRRTSQRYIPGILRHVKNTNDDYWELFDAEDYICRDNSDFSKWNKIGMNILDGSQVSFSVSKREKGKPFADLDGNSMTGYLLKGNENGPELKKKDGRKCTYCPAATKKKCALEKGKKCYLLMKHNYHVFREKGHNSSRVTGASLKQFSGVLELYMQNKSINNAYKEYNSSWMNVKNNGGSLPVYYNYVDDLKQELLLSPACITREVYQNTFKKIIGTRYSTCSEHGCLCPACQLFGIVNTNTGIQKASSIRFADLKVIPKTNYYGEPITLEELGTPKPSSMEFYLKKPEVELNNGERLLVWTYDYYITVDSKGSTRVVLYDPEIAGRKMYWHSKNAASRQMKMSRAKELESKKENKEKDIYITIRNKTIRPVEENVCFEGYVYFEKISATELNRLIAILDMSNPKIDGKRYAMKLGAAKPLGFGSVETRVDSVNLRALTIQDGVVGFDKEKFYNIRPSLAETNLFDSATINNLELLNLDAINENNYTIHYPYVNESDALSGKEEGFNWFVNNRVAFGYQKKPKPGNPGKMIDDKEHLDLNCSNIYPGERKQVPFREYLKATEPVFKVNFETTHKEVKRKNQTDKAIWISKYSFSPEIRIALKKAGMTKYYDKCEENEWPNEGLIKKYAKNYRTILLPGNDIVNIT